MHVVLPGHAREPDRSGRRADPLKGVSAALEERVGHGQVRQQQLAAGADQSIRVAHGEGHEELARGGRADRRVQLHLLDPLEQLAVAAREPADAQAGKPVGLRDRTQRDRAAIAIARGCETGARVVLEPTVHLVAQQHDLALGRQLEHAREGGRVHLRSGWVVWAVDVDELGLRQQQLLQRVEVMRPTVLVTALPHAHVRARAARQLDRGAVAGNLDDGVIAAVEQRVRGDEDALLGRRQREHLVGLDALVASCDRTAKLARAGHLGIPQPQAEQTGLGVGLERQQVGHGARLAVAAREHQLGTELPLLVEALDRKRRDPHR